MVANAMGTEDNKICSHYRALNSIIFSKIAMNKNVEVRFYCAAGYGNFFP